MTVGEICSREVVITRRDASVLDSARLMNAHHVGDLVVVKEPDGQRMPIGIVTDRDIALALVDWPDRVAQLAVGDVMSTNLVTSHEGENLYDTLKKMQSYGIRRLPSWYSTCLSIAESLPLPWLPISPWRSPSIRRCQPTPVASVCWPHRRHHERRPCRHVGIGPVCDAVRSPYPELACGQLQSEICGEHSVK